jgi:hypothetical protein
MDNTTPPTPAWDLATDGRFGDYGLYLLQGKPDFDYIFSISSTLGFVHSPPLPCWTRMSIRSLSISVTFRQIASETHSPTT